MKPREVDKKECNEMKPKAINEKDWNILKKNYKINLKVWENLDGLKKINLLRDAKVSLSLDSKINLSLDTNKNKESIFGDNYNLSYPKDIYTNRRIILDKTILTRIHEMVLNEKKEIGGIINDNKIDFLFNGNENRIHLDLKKKTQTLFHTHPEDKDILFDPPSVLDIVSFLALTVQSIADFILNNDGEKNINDILKVQNCIVFTKNEIYVYYISYPLILTISEYLMNLMSRDLMSRDLMNINSDYIYEVEKLLEEIELNYSNILSEFNMTLDEELLLKYISQLNSLGILVKRFSYFSYFSSTSLAEVYVF